MVKLRFRTAFDWLSAGVYVLDVLRSFHCWFTEYLNFWGPCGRDSTVEG